MIPPMRFSVLRGGLVAAALLVLPRLLTGAEPLAIPMPADTDAVLRRGLDALYDLDYDGAVRAFSAPREQAEAHPLLIFGETYAQWARLSDAALEQDEDASRPFLEAAGRCLDAANKKLRSGDEAGEALLVLGSASGLLARWDAANRRWIPAYRRGKHARRYLERGLERNPRLHDAEMGLGMYEYFLATYPKYTRTLAFLLGKSDAQQGLAKLARAGQNGQYTSVLSGVFLAGMLSGNENRPADALPVLEELLKRYPGKLLIRMTLLQALYNAEQGDEFRKEAVAFRRDVAARHDLAPQGEFYAALADFRERRFTDADPGFLRAAQLADRENPYGVWARLYHGFCLDAMGERTAAKAAYNEVVGMRNCWHSRELAAHYLKTPFNESEKALTRLQL
jgi:hypothetical protein